MKKKSLLLMSGTIAILSFSVVGCTNGTEQKEVVKTMPGEETSVKDEEVNAEKGKEYEVYKPTPADIKRVMKEFPKLKEFQEKLAEVNIMSPVATKENVIIAGNGVEEYMVNIDYYQLEDDYVAVYSKEGKIVTDLPESIGQFEFSKGELEERLGYTLPVDE